MAIEASPARIEAQSLALRVESLATKVDFNERRVRTMEGTQARTPRRTLSGASSSFAGDSSRAPGHGVCRASVSLTRAPSMAAAMLLGMLLMALAAWMYSIATALSRVRSIILERERDAEWVRMQRSAA